MIDSEKGGDEGASFLTHDGGHVRANIRSLDSALQTQRLGRNRSRGTRVLDPRRGDLRDCPIRLVEHVASEAVLGNHHVLGPCVAGRNTRSGHRVSPPCARIPLYDPGRERISADKHCTAEAHKELIANAHKRIHKLQAESGGVDAGMPVDSCMYLKRRGVCVTC